MRVLLVGLGDIARKAYLPLLAATPGLELHLATRNAATLDELGEAYRIPRRYHSLQEALAEGPFDAAFVHAATTAHSSLAEQLLVAGIPVFVDKPLADNLADCERLVRLSEQRGCLLMVGFNRRYAPDVAALLKQPRQFCLLQKHRSNQLDEPRRTVFDDFVHVVDTLLFLAPAAADRVSVETIIQGGLLASVTLTLVSNSQVAIGSMHRNSGLDEERLDVIAEGSRISVLNLSNTRIQQGGQDSITRRPDWAPVARQRGFEAMCADFLGRVRSGAPTSSEQILATHRLCEQIVDQAER